MTFLTIFYGTWRKKGNPPGAANRNPGNSTTDEHGWARIRRYGVPALTCGTPDRLKAGLRTLTRSAGAQEISQTGSVWNRPVKTHQTLIRLRRGTATSLEIVFNQA